MRWIFIRRSWRKQELRKFPCPIWRGSTNPLPNSIWFLPGRFALLVPGSAPHRPDKRWPAEELFGELAAWISTKREIRPVILGVEDEGDSLAAVILRPAPTALNLIGRTSLFRVAALARRAVAAIGNDTGPMHLIAMVGCPSVVLFSAVIESGARRAVRTQRGGSPAAPICPNWIRSNGRSFIARHGDRARTDLYRAAKLFRPTGGAKIAIERCALRKRDRGGRRSPRISITRIWPPEREGQRSAPAAQARPVCR